MPPKKNNTIVDATVLDNCIAYICPFRFTVGPNELLQAVQYAMKDKPDLYRNKNLDEYKQAIKDIIKAIEEKKGSTFAHKQEMLNKVNSFTDNPFRSQFEGDHGNFYFEGNRNNAYDVVCLNQMLSGTNLPSSVPKDTILTAMGRQLATNSQGHNGIKELHKRGLGYTYTHELKIISMGDSRLYCRDSTGVFDTIGGHIDADKKQEAQINKKGNK